jgi:hypothetical protein
MLFICGLLLMWAEYLHNATRGIFEEAEGYWAIGLLGRIMCSVSLIHFAWFVLV